MRKAPLLPVVLALPLCLACEKVNLDEEDEVVAENSSSSLLAPVGHGLGTQARPLTPDELMDGSTPQDTSQCWVMGYAVGSTKSALSNAIFTVPTSYTSNILLANDSTCTDYTQCVAVELGTTSIISQFSLCNYPSGLHQFVVLCGTYGTYFRKVGLRSVSQGYWISGFDLATIMPVPEEWEEMDIPY